MFKCDTCGAEFARPKPGFVFGEIQILGKREKQRMIVAHKEVCPKCGSDSIVDYGWVYTEEDIRDFEAAFRDFVDKKRADRKSTPESVSATFVETDDLTCGALRKLGIRDFKINFNEYVKVKLTETGLKILREQCDELNSYISQRGGNKVFGIHNKTDDEGYTRFQIWDLINTFGTHLTMGLPEPFESTMIFLNGEVIGPVGKPPDSPQ